MKYITCIVFALVSFATAQSPQNLISDEALALVVIQDGERIKKSIQTISAEVGDRSDQGVLDALLSQFVKNPEAVDLEAEVIFAIEPGSVPEGQKPIGMFGPMPHLVMVCKPIEGKKLILNPFGGVNVSTVVDGWFVASGGNSWSPPSTDSLSPLFAELPDGQLTFKIKFGALWSQVGPITQMAGGMMIGQMNKPGPTGTIEPETRKRTAVISQAFRQLMQFCAKIQSLAGNISIVDGKVETRFSIDQKNPIPLAIDNSAMEEMATQIQSQALQYTMSGDFTRLLLNYQLHLLRNENDGFPVVAVTEGMRELADIQGDNVVMYGLEPKNGLTIAALAETTDIQEYLDRVPALIDEMASQFAEEFRMKLTPSENKSDHWDVQMLGVDEEDMQIMNAVITTTTTLSFEEIYGKIGFVFGSSKPFTNTQHETRLSRLIAANDDLSIAMAVTMDVREFAYGFLQVAEQAGTDQGKKIAATPPAIVECVLGANDSGFVFTFQADMLGLGRVTSEMN
ncbi:MAG: hypothetical protein QGI78_04480 [Phycisphaerales bacterium]|jgi:hypothetical protein|nr:hypothetical protein [Phycisphaerales bacterium]